VNVFPGRFTRSKPVARGWRLTIDAHAQSHLIDCGWVMDCTGRRSAFAASLGMKRLTFDKQVAAVVLGARDDRDRDRTILLEASANGWWYTAPVPHGHRIVIYFTDGDLVRDTGVRTPVGFRALAATTRHIRPFLADGTAFVRPPAVMLASTSRLPEPAGERWVAAGDAAATLDPLASMGIRDAIQGAMAAVNVVLGSGMDPHKYSESIISSHTRHLKMRLAYYRMETRWPDALFWSRRRAEF
jgi:flavin-dependent dehydrogenase